MGESNKENNSTNSRTAASNNELIKELALAEINRINNQLKDLQKDTSAKVKNYEETLTKIEREIRPLRIKQREDFLNKTSSMSEDELTKWQALSEKRSSIETKKTNAQFAMYHQEKQLKQEIKQLENNLNTLDAEQTNTVQAHQQSL